MKKDENGYIVVEAIGAFVPFIMFIVTILTLVNVVTTQARMHNALTQTANTLSLYSYVLHAMGADEIIMGIDGNFKEVTDGAQEIKTNINTVFTSLNNFDVQTAVDASHAAAGGITDAASGALSDPQNALQMLLSYGVGEAKNELFEYLVRPMIAHFLVNGDMSGKQYINAFNIVDGVDGLVLNDGANIIDLSATSEDDSSFINSEGEIKLIVRYDITYDLWGIILPVEEPKLSFKHTVVTKAWLGGRGEGYAG